MGYLDWNEALSVGYEEIDEQHKELIKILNDFLNSMREGKAKTHVGEILRFLDSYVKIHFATEEKYMKEYLYEGYGRHKMDHEMFIAEFNDISRSLNENGVSSVLVMRVQKSLCDWLKNHILTVDTKMGKFLREKRG